MKIELTNFRSFSNASFSFDGDYTLVSGPSGAGKTSIFMAINFALTGEGKKITKYGTTKCNVVLEHRNVVITRSRGPCRLLVRKDGHVYEDAEAQAVINDAFANWELGYVSQRLYKSFIMMTPADKLSLIEKMTFSDLKIGELHAKCKSLISERKRISMDAAKERETIERVMKDIGHLESDTTMSKEELITHLSTLKLDRSESVDKLEKAKQVVFRRRRIIDEIENVKREMKKHEDTKDEKSVDVEELVTNVDRYTRYQKERSVLDDKTPHSGMSEQEVDAVMADMYSLKVLSSKITNLQKLGKELAELDEYKKTHAVNIGACPACQTSLSSWNGCLSVTSCRVKNITLAEADECEKKRCKLQADISSLEEYEQESKNIRSMYEGDINPDEYITYLRHVKKNDKTWEACNALKCDKPSDEVDKVIKRAREIEIAKYAYDLAKKKLESLNTSLDTLVLSSSIDELAREIESVDNSIRETSEQLKAVEAKKQWDRIRELREIEKDMEKKIPSAVRLAALVKSAERMAMNDTINNINLRANIYLSRMIPSISANLSFTSTEKIDLKIVLEDGGSVDVTDVNSLSGGEFARVVLAFAIAMAEMNNVDTLILDESFASLDADTTDIVISAIKENFCGKVIVVAHQTTKGVFDRVIEL